MTVRLFSTFKMQFIPLKSKNLLTLEILIETKQNIDEWLHAC